MKFGQLIDESMGNVFLKKACTICGRETSPLCFLKKSKFSIALDQQSEVSYSSFLLHVQVEDYQNILKLRC